MKTDFFKDTSGPRVFISDADYDPSVMTSVTERIFDAFPFAWEGKNVLVKPNLLAGYKPEKAVTTHPSVVKAVVMQLVKRGANVVVGDNPGTAGYGMGRTVGKICGIEDASQGFFKNISTHPVRYSLSSKYIDSLMISKDVMDADVVVNLPKLKTHSLTFLTGAIKNTFGYVVGGDKMRAHSLAPTPKKFADMLLDIYRIKPPQLNIMDGVAAMEGNGPSNGTVKHVGKIIASDNAVTLDAVVTHLLDLSSKDIPLVDLAGKYGLGETDMANIRLNEPIVPLTDFKFPNTFMPGIAGVMLNRFLSRWINCIPEVEEQKCRQCRVCVDHCPVDAMVMEEEYPMVNRDKCINCYCCQEMCPENAIMLNGWLMKRIRQVVVTK